MDTYKKYASLIQILSIITIFSHVVLTTMHWFFPLAYKTLHQKTGLSIVREYNATLFSFGQKLSGFFFESIASVLLIYGFFLVICLMNLIKKNQYFNLETITLLRRITKIALTYVIYTILCGAILSVITSLHNAPGERIIALSFGAADVMNIMVFCFMFLMMTIFQKGYELKNEQELTI